VCTALSMNAAATIVRHIGIVCRSFFISSFYPRQED
jgi:hypothetical protein